jgi:DNA-directed RNA polymerase subunit RPC12/RpoP
MVSKELITIYKCDRCGKQMQSQYATLSLKHAGIVLGKDDLINKDLCIDCYDKMRLLFMDKDMMIINPKSCLAASNFYTIPAEKITTATT